MTGRNKSAPQQAVDGLTGVLAEVPWSVMDEYDEKMHGQSEQTPPADRNLALAYTMLLIAAALTAGYGLWFVAGAALAFLQ